MQRPLSAALLEPLSSASRLEQQRGGAERVASYGNADLVAGRDGESDAEPEDSEPRAGDDAMPAPATAARRGPTAAELRAETRRQEEAQWRQRAALARARIAAAKQRLAALDELWLVEGEYYVDEEGRPLIRNLAQLRELVAEAQRSLAAAERAFDELKTLARRESVPPGWLR